MEDSASRFRIELFANKLTNVAGPFKGISDPYAVLTLLPNSTNKQAQEVGRTEV